MNNRGRQPRNGLQPLQGFDMGAAGGISPVAQRIMASQAMGKAVDRPSTPPPPRRAPKEPPILPKPAPPLVVVESVNPTTTPNPNPTAYAPAGSAAYPNNIAVPTPLPAPAQGNGNWGHGNLLTSSPVAPPPLATIAPTFGTAKHSHWWVWAVIAFLIVVIGATAGLLWWQNRQLKPQTILNSSLAASFGVQSYKETLTTRKGTTTTTQHFTADFSKTNELRLSVDNADVTQTTNPIATTIVGNNYYAKEKISADLINHTTDPIRKDLLTKLNGQWVQVVKDGKVLQTEAAAALKAAPVAQSVPLIVPAPVIVGNFNATANQQLSSDLTKNSIYTTGPEKPVSEQLDGQSVWRMAVKVNADNVSKINVVAAQALGVKDTDAITKRLKGNVPSVMTMWVRQSDNLLLQYQYINANTTYTAHFTQLNDKISVPTPQVTTVGVAPLATTPTDPNASTPGADTPADDDIKNTIDDVFNAVIGSTDDGNSPPPANADDFMSLMNNQLSSDELKSYKIQFSTDVPTQIAQIFYAPSRVCNTAKDGVMESSVNSTFAIIAKLSNSLYCQDNVQ